MQEGTPYDQRIATNPQDAEAYYERALFFLEEQSDFEQAKEDFIQAINLNYELADSYSNLALIYDLQKNEQSALECLNKAIKIDPNHTVSWFALGTLHSIYGRHQEALSALAKVLAIESDFQDDDEFLEEDTYFSIEAFALRARIYLEIEDNALALAECQASRAFDPESNECELLEVVALWRLNQEVSAKNLFQQIIKDKKIDHESLNEHPIFQELKNLY